MSTTIGLQQTNSILFRYIEIFPVIGFMHTVDSVVSWLWSFFWTYTPYIPVSIQSIILAIIWVIVFMSCIIACMYFFLVLIASFPFSHAGKCSLLMQVMRPWACNIHYDPSSERVRGNVDIRCKATKWVHEMLFVILVSRRDLVTTDDCNCYQDK